MANKKVVLFFPGRPWKFGINDTFPPLSIMALGNYLNARGVKVELVDTRFEDYKKADLKDALFIGISALTGNPISSGLEIAKHVREINPAIPVVWGGVHATLLPEQTLQSPFVDIVVRGEGELTVYDLVKTLESGKSLDNVPGISFKDKNGKIRNNPDRPFMNLDESNDVSFDLLKTDRHYEPNKVFHYYSSRGCPNRCAFCYNTRFCKSHWRPKSAKKVISELKYVIDKYHPQTIEFIDDNFFVDLNRLKEIVSFLKKEFSGNWVADCRADAFKRIDADFLKLVRSSGCESLAVGVESGSERVLKYIQKDITIDDVMLAAKKCSDADIIFFGLFMVGFPTEKKEEVFETLELMDRIEKVNPKNHTIISSFSPYPGTKLFDIAQEAGFKAPQSLEEWGSWLFCSKDNLNWMQKETASLMEELATLSRLRTAKPKFPKSLSGIIKELGKTPFWITSNIRWNYRFFDYPYELKVWTLIQKQRGYF